MADGLQAMATELELVGVKLQLAAEKERVETYRYILQNIATALLHGVDDPAGALRAIETIVTAGEEFERNTTKEAESNE